MTNLVNQLADYLGNATYGFLALNFLFGLFCVILIWRRLFELRFRRQEAEAEFIDQLQQHLEAGDYDAAARLCDYDYRALPRLCLLMIAHRALPYSQLRQVVAESMQRDILGDLEYRLRSEEHTSELQSLRTLVCRLLLDKK